MCIVQLELVEGTSRESRRIMRSMDVMGTSDQDPSQWLKKVKLAIAKLYQENRELRQEPTTKTIEVSAAQGHEENITWLKR
jgi:hypothetical protein